MRHLFCLSRIIILFLCANASATESIHHTIPIQFKFEDNATSYGFNLNLSNTSQLIDFQKSIFSNGMIGYFQKRVPLLDVETELKGESAVLKNVGNYAMEINKISLGMSKNAKLERFSKAESYSPANRNLNRFNPHQGTHTVSFSNAPEPFKINPKIEKYISNLEEYLQNKNYKSAYYSILENHQKMIYVANKSFKNSRENELVDKYQKIIFKNIQDGILIAAYNDILPLKFHLSNETQQDKILKQITNLCLVHLDCFNSKIPSILILIEFYDISPVAEFYQDFYNILTQYPVPSLEKLLIDRLFSRIKNTEIYKSQISEYSIFIQLGAKADYLNSLTNQLFSFYAVNDNNYKIILFNVLSELFDL